MDHKKAKFFRKQLRKMAAEQEQYFKSSVRELPFRKRFSLCLKILFKKV